MGYSYTHWDAKHTPQYEENIDQKEEKENTG